MALDFPSSPALNDTYTEAGKTWRWNGTGWQLVTAGTVTNADISPTAEIAVSKLAEGTARQLLQTDAAGTGVEWTSNVDVPGTLDVTGAAVFDSTVEVTGALTKSGSNVVTVGDAGTVSTAMVANDAVTYAKLQNVSATDRLLGRSTAGAGDVEEIACTAAGRALIDDADAAAQRTTLGLGTLATQSGTFSGTSSGTNTGDQTITLTGDVTGSGTGSFATAIAAEVIVNADINASAAIAGTKISPNFGSQNVVTTGTATAASLNPTGSSVPTNGVYLPATNSVAISSNAVQRVNFGTSEVVFNDGGENYDFRIEGDTNANLFFVDASTDRVGLGTSSPNELLEVTGNIHMSGAADRTIFNRANNALSLGTNNTARLHITNAGSVGIGTTSPGYALDVAAAGSISAAFTSTSSENYIALTDSGTTLGHVRVGSLSGALAFRAGNAERARIDSSGSLLINTSSDFGGGKTQVANGSLNIGTYIGATSGAFEIIFTKSRSSAIGTNTLVASADNLGQITFKGGDGTQQVTAAAITASVDGIPGANDMPGRLIFSTTADGASSPTERMRIRSDGSLLYGAGVYPYRKRDSRVINASATATVFDLWDGNPGRGLWLISATASSGNVNCRATVIAFSSSSSVSAVYSIVDSTGITIGVSGSSITVNNTSVSNRTIQTTAIPLSIDGN
jgi:hypothetical protein